MPFFDFVSINYLCDDNCEIVNLYVRIINKISFIRRLTICFLLLFPAILYAQVPITLSGYVYDNTGEVVVGATIYTSDKSVGVTVDETGYYSIRLTDDSKSVICSCIGYLDSKYQIESEKHDFYLVEDKEQLDASYIYSQSKRDLLKLPQMGAQLIDAASVKALPSFLGETDIIKVIQMLPGVQTPSEGSTGFSVRGGGIDQNLILMDSAPVFNCGHFLGFFSIFNGDAVNSAQLYKGDFPAKYGGRMASVLDISMKDGNMNKFSGSASIGLIASKISLEGPIAKDKASFIISARRSYLDAFIPLVKNKIDKSTKLSFYDINAKISWNINSKNRLTLQAFNSNDRFGLKVESFNIDLMLFDYTNNIQSIKWTHQHASQATTNVTLYNSICVAGIDCDMTEASFMWRSRIGESGVKYSTAVDIGQNNSLEIGANLANVSLRPSETHPTAEDSFVNDVTAPYTFALNPSLYIQNVTTIGNFVFRYGLRYSYFAKMGATTQLYFDPETYEKVNEIEYGKGEVIKTYGGFEPRASLSYSTSEHSSIKASYSRAIQYIQQAVVSASGSVLDTWCTASPNVKPQISDQYSLGYNQNIFNDAVELTLEGFYKFNRNTVDLKDNPGIVIDNKEYEGLLRFGKSWSYGVETMAKFEFEKVNGWLSYTWSKAFNKIDGINNGEPYRSPVNHEHTVNAVVTYDMTKRVSASASWIFASGSPTTFPVARYYFLGSYTPIYSSRNSDSMPNYHRLDLSLNIMTKNRAEGKRWGGQWSLSIYNAYARHNAWTISTNYSYTQKTEITNMIYLFSIVPSISYSITF